MFQIGPDIVEKSLSQRLRFEIGRHLGIQTSQRTQTRLPVRIRQTADIEYEIRIGRNPLFVGERLDHE